MQVFEGVELRPYARQGKAYVAELREIIHEEGALIQETVQRLRALNDDKITFRLVGALAITCRLNYKAMMEHLEDQRLVKRGSYDRVAQSSLRIRDVLASGSQWLQDVGESVPPQELSL